MTSDAACLIAWSMQRSPLLSAPPSHCTIISVSADFLSSKFQLNKSFQEKLKMNFLSKLLQGIAFVPAVVHGIEGLFGSRAGNDKKQAALSFIESALSMGEAIAAKDIVDNDKFSQGLAKVIDGTVDCLNASIWAKAR